MPGPSDPSYASALKWAQDFKNSNKNSDTNYIAWLFLGIFILILIIGYFWVKSYSSKLVPTGALATLEPNGKYPRMIVDGVGKVHVVDF
jgi:hypothetical protein